MFDVLRELMMYILFVMILVVISYSSQDRAAFAFKANLDNSFIKKGDIFQQDYTMVSAAVSVLSGYSRYQLSIKLTVAIVIIIR